MTAQAKKVRENERQKSLRRVSQKCPNDKVNWSDNRIVDNVPVAQSDDAQKIIADIEQWRQELNQKGGDDSGENSKRLRIS